jgi:hypothetical protein
MHFTKVTLPECIVSITFLKGLISASSADTRTPDSVGCPLQVNQLALIKW